MGRHRRYGWIVVAWLGIQLAAAPARGDAQASPETDAADSQDSSAARAAQLGAQLSKASASPKTKLSAIAALARLGGRHAVAPLVTALADSSPTVRALAAAALGKIAQKSALPSLRQVSADPNENVRVRVAEAIRAITKANGLTQESAGPTAQTGAGFGRDARTTESNPDLYVILKSCNDDSPGRTDKKARTTHADVVRAVMMASLREAPLVTSVATDAKRLSLHPRIVDASVVKMVLRTKGRFLEVQTELRLAISDDSGKMLSFLTGGAVVSVPKKGFNWSYLPALRKTALENAVHGLFEKLLAHLRSTVAA
jgi:HEAT repeats